MTQATFSVRMDEGLKRDFSAFCENVGMNMSTAIVVFAKTVVREHQFPFVISERPFGGGENRQSEVTRQARAAVERMRRRVEESDVEEPTMDEINSFISNVRAQRRSRSRRMESVRV